MVDWQKQVYCRGASERLVCKGSGEGLASVRGLLARQHLVQRDETHLAARASPAALLAALDAALGPLFDALEMIDAPAARRPGHHGRLFGRPGCGRRGSA